MEHVVSLNDVYHVDAMFYWCNAMGEINMPGEASYSPHTPEELPPAYRELYEKYEYETDSANTYVVSYDGMPGMLLTALHSNGYYDDVANLSADRTDWYDRFHLIMMDVAFHLIHLRAEAMTKDDLFDGCVVLVGDFTDPDGHELCLFVPADKCDRLDAIREKFVKNYCWNKEDAARVKRVFEVLPC